MVGAQISILLAQGSLLSLYLLLGLLCRLFLLLLLFSLMETLCMPVLVLCLLISLWADTDIYAEVETLAIEPDFEFGLLS